jgi:hypothetical protein
MPQKQDLLMPPNSLVHQTHNKKQPAIAIVIQAIDQGGGVIEGTVAESKVDNKQQI